MRSLQLTVLVIAVLLWFSVAMIRLGTGQAQEGREQLETALRRAAVACYAAEGCYPPSLEHLQTYYGVQINTEIFTVKYEVIASNLMPDITVLVN